MTATARPSSLLRRLSANPAWAVVLVCYGLLYGAFLLRTDGYPYVLDNNESYSSWWHARSLYENGVAHTKGLTDEVFSTSPAASPYVHTHQGNFPRLFTFLLYSVGFRSIAAQIWITTFTVGLAGIYFAFRFLSGLANPRYATIACLVMMTNYLLFAQWQVSLYNVWHVFFFFSSLLCVRALGHPEHRRRWALLALLNFAAFFYWEYVFTAFVTVLAGLYALALYWRRPLTLLRVWFLEAAGAVLAAAVLLAQLTAYMGWENMREDVRLTLTARNSAADPALLERVTSFYREHSIIFWHNFLDATPLRTLAAFWDSLCKYHLEYYTPPLVLAMFLIGLGWVLGLWRPWPSVRMRRRPTWRDTPASGVKWLGLVASLGGMTPGLFPPESAPSLHSPVLWLGAAAFGLLLGRLWLGGWWAWMRLGWSRLIPLTIFSLVSCWLLRPTAGLSDPSFDQALAEAAGWTGWEAMALLIPPGAIVLGLSCAVMGSSQLLGLGRSTRMPGLPILFLCGLLAYGATYRIFTGYVYSGYLHRLVPMLVFVTDLLLALALYAAIRPIRRFARQRESRIGTSGPWSLHSLPLLLSVFLVALLLFQWVHLQLGYVRVVPPDRYSFLTRLEQAPYKGRSVVTNTYPAPMAARTGAWGYADTSIFSGRVTLTPWGFETERDLKYLWFADRDTNPAYLKPDLAVTVIQIPSLSVAMQLQHEREEARPGTLPLAESSGLVQRAHPLQQAFLLQQLTYSDGRHVSFVKLDWDYPPFLHSDYEGFLPAVRNYSLAQKLTLSESAETLHRRWRVTLTPVPSASRAQAAEIVLRKASVDFRPVFPADALAAAGWQPVFGTPENPGESAWRGDAPATRPLTAVVEGDLVSLDFWRSPSAGKVRVEVNDMTEEIDLRSPDSARQSFSFSSALPHGRHTFIPTFTPGVCVQTSLGVQGDRAFAEVRYHYAQQEGAPESGTIVRIYLEESAGHWRLADTITFLGPLGIPVRLEEFRRTNPNTTAEHARIARAGDTRTYAQWLADHLTAHPAEWHRTGIVAESLVAPVSPKSGAEPVVRRVPLPSPGSGRLQLTVTPGTRTKSGPEYFGLPFSVAEVPSRSLVPVAIDYRPPVIDAGAPLPFGRLKLRVRFPPNRWPQSEPIVTTGTHQAGDFLYVIYVDKDHIRFGFDHWFRGGPVTRPIRVDYSREHELEISLGSLFPPRESIAFATMPPEQVASVKDRVLVKLDGQVVLDAAGDCYESSCTDIVLGRNAIKGTTSGPVFYGEILSSQRIWPWSE